MWLDAIGAHVWFSPISIDNSAYSVVSQELNFLESGLVQRSSLATCDWPSS